MAKAESLEKRIQILEDKEAIKELKAKYWRLVDKKLWKEWSECFVKDAEMDIPPVGKLRGIDQIVKAISEGIGPSVSVHQGGSPEIEITGDTTATGKWALQDHVFDERSKTTMTGFGLYEDEYLKENGQWKIKTTRITHLHMDRTKKQ